MDARVRIVPLPLLLHRNVLIIFVDTRLELQLPGQEQEIASHSLDPIFPRATDLSPTFHHFLIRCLPTSPVDHFISPLINAEGKNRGKRFDYRCDRSTRNEMILSFFFFLEERKELEAPNKKSFSRDFRADRVVHPNSILRDENINLISKENSWTRLQNCSINDRIDKSGKLSCFSIKYFFSLLHRQCFVGFTLPKEQRIADNSAMEESIFEQNCSRAARTHRC